MASAVFGPVWQTFSCTAKPKVEHNCLGHSSSALIEHCYRTKNTNQKKKNLSSILLNLPASALEMDFIDSYPVFTDMLQGGK